MSRIKDWLADDDEPENKGTSSLLPDGVDYTPPEKGKKDPMDLGLDLAKLSLGELVIMSANGAGAILMLPSIDGTPEKAFGFAFVLAGISPEISVELKQVCEAVMVKHGFCEPGKADMMTREHIRINGNDEDDEEES